jgi:hypothetical protein
MTNLLFDKMTSLPVKRKRKFWVTDYETIVNCFVAVFENLDSKETKVFTINRKINQISELLDFFKENIEHKDWHFGFNIDSFDGQITEYILENSYEFAVSNADLITSKIYAYAQEVINKSSKGEFLDYPNYKFNIPTVDIFKLNHWDSNAKRASLKWIQFTMDWHNVEEMPHPHWEPINDDKTLTEVIVYCVNDVSSTKAIFLFKNKKKELLMIDQINLRAELSKTYDLHLFSASEPRISKEVFAHFLCKKLKIKKYDLKDMRTIREYVKARNIILPYVSYETPEFKSMLNWFKSLEINTILLEEDENSKKPKLKYSFTKKGVRSDFGLGGIHGCIKPGIYKSGNGKSIISADVTSFYPMLAIKNGWSPSHLDADKFIELYQWFFDERSKYKKGTPLNYLFKIVLNATYGLSKNRHSFLYDPEFTFKITVNGQLLLSMLYEMVMLAIPSIQPLMQNTDGLEFMIDDVDKQVFYQVCKKWENFTQLSLETVEYDKMIIADVNNYIAIDKSGKVKCKGRFEFEEIALHKNKSYHIIPKAWYAYFVNGVEPEDYLKSNRNIFDYCAGVKLKGDWKFESVEMLKELDEEFKKYTLLQKREYLRKNGWEESWSLDNWVKSDAKNKEANTGLDTNTAFRFAVSKSSVLKRTELQKMVRYYNSKQGVKLMKIHKYDGRELQLQAGKTRQTIFNKYEKKNWESYNVDEEFYLKKIREEIVKIEKGIGEDTSKKEKKKILSNQLMLF